MDEIDMCGQKVGFSECSFFFLSIRLISLLHTYIAIFFIEQVVVQKFQKKQHPNRQTSWTNLYIKNIPVFSEHFTEDDLLAMFTKFGPVSSLKIMNFNDDDVIKDAASSKPRGVVSGASKGFGFVAFGQHEVFELFFCQKGHPL